MIEILSDEYIIARKQYKCALCGDNIKIGDKHNKITYPYGGTIESYRLHTECRKALNDYSQETGEREWSASGVMEFVNEELREEGVEPAKYIRDAVLQYCKL